MINIEKQLEKKTLVIDEDAATLEVVFSDRHNRDKNYKVKVLVGQKSLGELMMSANQEIKDFINEYKRFNDEQQENCVEYFELTDKDAFEEIINIPDGIYFKGQYEYSIFENIDDKAGILISQVESEKDFLRNEIKIIENLIKQEKTLIRSIPNRTDVWLNNHKKELEELKEELKKLD
jgi:hypothetical protein